MTSAADPVAAWLAGTRAKFRDPAFAACRKDGTLLVAALEAVLARHHPWEHHDYPQEGATCAECGDWYPCNTVRDLESALRDAQGGPQAQKTSTEENS